MFAVALVQTVQISSTKSRVLGEKTIAVVPTTILKRPTTPTVILPTFTPTPTPTPTPTQTPTKSGSTSTPNPQTSENSQYTSEKIGETTFRIRNVQSDSQMGSSQDIFNALNSYRQSRGVGQLSWDGALSDLANSRVNTFASKGDLDGHAGFQEFMNNDGFSKAGFNGLGENSARLAGPMSGDRIIKEIFGADAPHDTNQLNPEWTHAAVAVNGNFVNVNFGRGKR